MKKRVPTIVIYVLFACLVVLFGVGLFLVVKKSPIRNYNKTVRGAAAAYRGGNYKLALLHLTSLKDSLQNTSDEVKLNIAHAGFLISGMDKTDNVVSDIMKGKIATSMKDTLDAASYIEYYREVATTSGNKELSSVAYSQMGIVAYNLIHTNLDEPEEVISEALGYFKAAIKKDRSNYIARYNYELLKRKREYPEQIMKKVKSLINERKYALARNILVTAMGKDPAIEKKNPDFLKRLDDIIRINGND